MGNNIKVAVIIFHKNVKKYPPLWIQECIFSIQRQTHKEFDVFECDYGAGKNQIYPDSKFFNKRFKTHAHAHNFLLDEAFKTHDVAFNVNIDDYYHPDRFKKQLRHIKPKGPEHVVSSNYILVDEYGVEKNRTNFNVLKLRHEMLKGHNIIAHPSVLYSREFWQKCSRLDPDEIPQDDLKLWQREHRKFRFKILKDYLLYYRDHKHKIS